jgi:NAD(P)H-nitrite reductase large subunit
MSLEVIVTGGVAAGPKAAAKIVRLNPEAEVTIIEKGKHISYAGCGLPYYLSGVVKEQKDLMSTPIGVVRDPGFFQKVKKVKVLTETEAVEINRAQKRVRARRNGEGSDTWLDYDKLVLATGAKPIVPPIPKVTLGNITPLRNVPDADAIRALLARAKPCDVVMIGAGLIGITPMEVRTMLETRRDFVILDVRSPAEHQQEQLDHATLIPLGALRSRLSELPRDKEIVTFCKVSLRGYEAARILQGAGFPRVKVMDGGMAVWPYDKLHG